MAKRGNVLIVDDDIEIRATMSDILADRGYVFSIAENGRNAIELVKKKYFDLVLMDVRLPGMNGLEIYREIRKYILTPSVIMVTGALDVKEITDQGLKEGIYNVLYKPLDVKKLLQLFDEIQKKKKILIVDDSDEDRSSLGDILTEKGYRVGIASDGYEAVQVINKIDFGMVLLDMKMPKMDGLKTLEWIKEMKPALRVVMVSAYPIDDYVGRAMREGALAYLHKPIDIDKLLGMLEKIPAT